MKSTTDLKRINISGLEIDPITIGQANQKIAYFIGHPKEKTQYVVKPYVEFAMRAKNDPHIRSILAHADLVLADGVSLQWAASYLYGKPNKAVLKLPRSGFVWLQKSRWRNQILPEKMAGANQTKKLLDIAQQKGWRIGILGGRDQPNAIKAAIQRRWPQLEQVYVWSGFFSQSTEAELVLDIQSKKLDLLFVAMGFPRQEIFIARNLGKNIATVMIGEGGTFDYNEMGGRIHRAPKWMQSAGLEWLWRLFREPQRISRQLAIPRFVFAIWKQSIHKNAKDVSR